MTPIMIQLSFHQYFYTALPWNDGDFFDIKCNGNFWQFTLVQTHVLGDTDLGIRD